MSLSTAQFIDRAAWLSRELTRMRCSGPGGVERAMRQLEATYGIPFSVVWRLRFRQQACKSICAAIYARLEHAYLSECERQQNKLAREIAIAKILAGSVVGPPATGAGHPGAPQGISQDVGKKN